MLVARPPNGTGYGTLKEKGDIMSKMNVTANGHSQGNFLNAAASGHFMQMTSGAPDRGLHDASGAGNTASS